MGVGAGGVGGRRGGRTRWFGEELEVCGHLCGGFGSIVFLIGWFRVAFVLFVVFVCVCVCVW